MYWTPANWTQRQIKIVLVGVGGTGSRLLTQLADMDVVFRQLGHPGFCLTAFDADTVEEPNLGRQAFLPMDLGHNKAMTLVHRLSMSRGLHEWFALPEKFVPAEMGQRGGAIDWLITAVDSATFRLDVADNLARPSQWHQMLWLDTGNTQNSGQVVLGHLQGQARDGLRLPHVVDLFRGALSATDDDEQPSCSMEEALRKQDFPINGAMAQVGVELLWQLLRHGSLDTHGVCVDLRRPGGYTPIPIDPVVWARMGYQEEETKAA